MNTIPTMMTRDLEIIVLARMIYTIFLASTKPKSPRGMFYVPGIDLLFQYRDCVWYIVF